MATNARKGKSRQEERIGYCGLYCGDCFGYTGTIADLARDLRKELRRAHFDELAAVISQVPTFKAFESYGQCYDVLEALTKLRCKKTCRGNGGPPQCEIRQCNREKHLAGCWQCDAFKTCTKLDMLRAHHGDAHLRNLSKIQRNGTAAFVEGKRYWRVMAKTKQAGG